LFLAQTVLATVNGSDGSICTLDKSSTINIRATYSCTTADQRQSLSGVIAASNLHNATGSVVFAMNTITCLVGLNATAAAVSMGSLGTVPPHGIAWSCTGDGSTTIAGTAVWP
jgi:hypothetical protein